MTALPKSNIKAYFQTGDLPTQGQFSDLIDSYVNSIGDTMTGELVLYGNPVSALGATPKQYVDAISLVSANITSGTINGATIGATNPSTGSFTVVSASTVVQTPAIILAGGTQLSNYVQGIFTPTLIGLSVAGSPTYSAQQGIYTRIGRLVHINAHITLTALGGMTGQLAMNGLPFTVNSSELAAFAIGTYSNFSSGITTTPLAIAPGSTTQIRFSKSGAGSSVALDSAADITSTLDVWINGIYQI